MEHLGFQRAESSVLIQLEIPCFPPGKFVYDGPDAVAFVQRFQESGQADALINHILALRKKYINMGPTIDGTGQFKDDDLTTEDDELCISVLSLIQHWLYFGFLVSVFRRAGLLVNPQDFMRIRSDGTQVKSSAPRTLYTTRPTAIR